MTAGFAEILELARLMQCLPLVIRAQALSFKGRAKSWNDERW
jgi:hypothetical protein